MNNSHELNEPVAWFYRDNLGRPCSTTKKPLSPFKDMQPLYTTPPAQRATEESSATQPAVPDAFGTREGEHPEYIQGWNDCRAEMLKGVKP
jgi:hypothetical protein